MRITLQDARQLRDAYEQLSLPGTGTEVQHDNAPHNYDFPPPAQSPRTKDQSQPYTAVRSFDPDVDPDAADALDETTEDNPS